MRQLREQVCLISFVCNCISCGALFETSITVLQSGSRIHISDGSSSDRIVTVTGNLNSIYKAFNLITAKVQEVSRSSATHFVVKYEQESNIKFSSSSNVKMEAGVD